MNRWMGVWRGAALLAALLALCAPANAHPGVGHNLRALHVAHDIGGATVYLRLSLPLIVADKLGASKPDGSFEPAPFTYNRVESGRVFHYFDFDALRRDSDALAALVAAGHELRTEHRLIAPTVLAMRVHVKGQVPAFKTLDDARAALAGPLVPQDQSEIDSGYVLVDTALRYTQAAGIAAYGLRSTLIPGELGEPQTLNVIWDHRGESTEIHQTMGLLHSEWLIRPSEPR